VVWAEELDSRHHEVAAQMQKEQAEVAHERQKERELKPQHGWDEVVQLQLAAGDHQWSAGRS
jgi:hypothetical protein